MGKEGILSMQHRTEPCQKNIRLTILGTLAAVELLMSFSFLGYLHIEPLSITFAYIPVLLAGAMAGVPEAAAVGALFGLASMWKASASYVASFDEIKENNFNLNIPRYVDTFEEEKLVDIDEVQRNIVNIETELAQVQKQMKTYLMELNL